MQLSLFDTIKLSELYTFVHENGKWQNENCYKTVIEKIQNSLIIANVFTYGSKKEQEKSHDTIIIDILNSKGKITTLWKGENTEINSRFRKLLKKLENNNAFDDYVIEIDMKIRNKLNQL